MTPQKIFGMISKEFSKDVDTMHPLELAYLGDAIYELFVRSHLLSQGVRKPQELQKNAIAYVSAVAQAESCHRILPLLSEEEREIVKKGRNTKTGNIPKSASVSQYRYSTGLEALFGYLYLKQRTERIDELMKIILEVADEENVR